MNQEVMKYLKNFGMKKCSICNSKYYGYGNNAQPINEGRCCNECNVKEVIPARIDQLLGRYDKVSEDKDASN